MTNRHLIDPIISFLEHRKLQGMQSIAISSESLAYIRETKSPTVETAPAPKANAPTVETAPAPKANTPTVETAPDPRANTQTIKTEQTPDSPVPASDGIVQEEAAPYNKPDLSQYDWEKLEALVKTCTQCPLSESRKQTVFGTGNKSADLMFIGEGPGADEDAQGIPFVGVAGQLLTQIIAAMNYGRDDVYIANIVKCRPPGNRNPQDAEADKCLPYLERQIELVDPKVIVLLGAVPLNYLLNMKGIMRSHGKWMSYKGIDVMPSFHPAFLLRKPEHKRDAWEDMQKVMEKLGKPSA